MAYKSWPRSLNASDWRLAILPICLDFLAWLLARSFLAKMGISLVFFSGFMRSAGKKSLVNLEVFLGENRTSKERKGRVWEVNFSKTLRRGLRNASFLGKDGGKRYRYWKNYGWWQNTTDSSAVPFLVRKGPLGNSGEKKEPKPELFVRISSVGVGVFHVKGWGPKNPVCPSKPRETKLFGGISPGILPGYPGGCPKSFRQKIDTICVQRKLFLPVCGNQPEDITQKRVHTDQLTARDRGHWFFFSVWVISSHSAG